MTSIQLLACKGRNKVGNIWRLLSAELAYDVDVYACKIMNYFVLKHIKSYVFSRKRHELGDNITKILTKFVSRLVSSAEFYYVESTLKY